MRLLSYVVKYDKGFAPNPFSGLCTLAACTPNHMGARLEESDWVLGNSTTSEGRKLIYAMRVSEVLDFDYYYRDRRFAAKKPRGSRLPERCGDNIYFRNAAGQWEQTPGSYHTPEDFEPDTRHPRVFISDHFFYFGAAAPEIPEEFSSLLQTRQGFTYHEGQLVTKFVNWLEREFSPPGRKGWPRDAEDAGAGCAPALRIC